MCLTIPVSSEKSGSCIQTKKIDLTQMSDRWTPSGSSLRNRSEYSICSYFIKNKSGFVAGAAAMRHFSTEESEYNRASLIMLS
jgi:hypothetical protein